MIKYFYTTYLLSDNNNYTNINTTRNPYRYRDPCINCNVKAINPTWNGK